MHTVVTVLLVVLGLYLLACVALHLFQGRLVHIPSKAITAVPTDVGLPFEEAAFAAADGVRLHGWRIPPPREPSDTAPGAGFTILFCHGNAGNIGHRLETMAIFHRLGAASLFFDYRGYGRSEGSPTEEGLYADARAAQAFLAREHGAPPERLVVWGRSLGGAVASRLAMELSRAGTPPAGLALECAFTSIPAVGQRHYPIFPVKRLSRITYPTLRHLADVRSPVLVAHGPADRIVPYAMGRELHAAAPSPKRFLELAGGHNDFFRVMGKDYEVAVGEWLASLRPSE